MNPLNLVLFLQAGYLVGSLNPSYFLGKLIKNIDIREQGTGNAGATNTYRVLGLGPAIITVVFDLSKGLLVMYLAYLIGASPLFIHLAGFSVVLGHVFPFYIHFKGGQGVATATAILIYYLILFYSREWLPWESLLLLSLCAFSFRHITRTGEVVGAVVLPVLAINIIVFSPHQDYQIFILTVIGYILFINIRNIRHFQLIDFSSPQARSELNWRLFIRPLTALLIVYYLQRSKIEVLTLIGSIALFFLLLDLIRLVFKKINIFFYKSIKDFYKKKEYRRISSITIFLGATFMTFFLFERSIAIFAVSYLIFGDFFSKFFGVLFSRTKLFDKSLEGSLAHFNACLISGFILLHFISVSVPTYLAGAFTASLSELLPLKLDDNFSVPLLSASTMSILQIF